MSFESIKLNLPKLISTLSLCFKLPSNQEFQSPVYFSILINFGFNYDPDNSDIIKNPAFSLSLFTATRSLSNTTPLNKISKNLHR